MKKSCFLVMIVMASVLVPKQSHAIFWVAAKAVLKKAIKAADLQIQRLQNKTIELQNAQKAIENTLSKTKLLDIGDWLDKQRKLYQTYYDELHKVRTIISYYQRIKDIISNQATVINEYKNAMALFKKDAHFHLTEIERMQDVYSGMVEESINNLDELMLVVNALSTQMTDAQRLEIISSVDTKISMNIAHLREFTTQNKMLSLQRSQGAGEVDFYKKLYGIK